MWWKYDLGDRSDTNVTGLATDPRVVSFDQVDRGETPGTFKSPPWTAPKGGNVSVIWDTQLTDAERRVLEQRYHLEPDDRLPDTMAAYALLDASPDAIRALVSDPNVVDVSGIDQARLRPSPDSWFTALGRRYDVMRLVPAPRLFFKENAGVWLYYVSFCLPLVVFLVLLSDRARGRASAAMPGEAQKMFAVAALMVVANFALLRKLGYFPDHIDAAAIMAAWLLGRALRCSWRTLSGAAIGLVAVLVTGVSSVAAFTYVDLPTFVGRLKLSEPVPKILAIHTERLSAFSTSPPIDSYAPPDAEADRAVIRYLYECTRPDDRIFVTSDIYTVPYYTQRRVVGHIFWANGFMATPDFERRMIELMEREQVPLVFGAGGPTPLENLSQYPLVRDYVAKRYTGQHTILQDQLAGTVLWLLTDSRRTPTGTYEALGLPCFK